MCGIFGWAAPQASGSAEQLSRGIAMLRHRGPDDEGFCFADDGRVALAYCRLSIIDLSDAARQPMSIAQEGLTLVFNGEIYNYRELRHQLEGHGVQFHTQSDTEVLLRAWAKWGPGCLARFTGMFAIALHDARRRSLYLARDCFGIKPLYYSRHANRVVFSSEIPPLLDVPGTSRRANANRVFDFLQDGVTDYGGETFFADISQLPPAHFWEIPLDGSVPGSPIRYWDLPRDRECDLSFDDASKRLRELFLESVSLHLRSDVPLGVALSGGIDSSSVLLASRRLLGPAADIRTYSYIARDPTISEETWVDDANRAAGAIPHKFDISCEDIVRDFEELNKLQCEPVHTPVVYAQWRVFRQAASTGIKVLLEGQGADETLAGYPTYVPARLASLIRGGQFAQAARFREATRSSWRGVLSASLPSVLRRGIHRLRAPGRVFPWIRRAWSEQHSFGPKSLSRNGHSAVREALYKDLAVATIPAFLRWADRSSMACSVENRVPFLTPKLAEFLFSLPEEYLLGSDGTSKKVFRAAMRGITPDPILNRKVKIGFTTPYCAWLQALRPQVRSLLEIAEQIPALDRDAVHSACGPFLAGASPSLAVTHRLWGVLFLCAWTRRFGIAYD